MKKYKKLIIATIIALIFIGTFVFLWQKSQPKEIVYNEFTPEMNEVKKTTIITGKIEPRNEVNIKPQIGGIITDLYKEPGDYVQAGEVIAKVKVIPDMGQLSSAESRVRLASLNLKQAQVDYEREKSLYDQQLVSADEFDKIRQKMTRRRRKWLPHRMRYRWSVTVCRNRMPVHRPPLSVPLSVVSSWTSLSRWVTPLSTATRSTTVPPSPR